jgi:hypothetical protein
MQIQQVESFSRQYGGAAFSPDLAGLRGIFGLTEDDMMKALATNGTVGTNASAMIGESLDPLVKRITLDPENHCILLQRLEAYKAKAISEQSNRITSLGLAEYSRRQEGKLGPQDAATYQRRSKVVRFGGQVAAVTTTMARAAEAKFDDFKQMEIANRVHATLLHTEKQLYWGDTRINELDWEGFGQQIEVDAGTDADFQTDLAVEGSAGSRTTKISGGTLTASQLRAQARNALKRGGVPTMALISSKDKELLGVAEDGSIRYLNRDQKSPIAKGMIVDQVVLDFGARRAIDLVWSLFLDYNRGKLSDVPANPSDATKFHELAAPQLASGAFAGAAAAGGHLPNDTYYYGIAAVSDVGEGPIRLLSTGYTADNTNGTIDLTITLPGDLSQIKSWRIYRSTVNGTDYTKMRFLKEVALDDSGATQVISDDGAVLPSSREAALLNERMTSLGFLQPMSAWDLPYTDSTHRVAIECELVVQNYAPEHCHRFINIGGTAATPE